MNIPELKEVLKHIKKVLPCNVCNKKFGDDAIQVLSTCCNEGILHLSCYNCNNELLVHVSIVEEGAKTNRLNIRAQNAQNISYNDVLDIHNFLEKFNGDFKQLFSL